MGSFGGRRVLVTGASGFIGRNLCRRLQEEGATVVGLMRKPHDGPWHEAVLADLGKKPVAVAALAGVDTIFHLAGKAHVNPRTAAEMAEYEQVHVTGTRMLLASAHSAGVRGMVFLSSVKAMGEGGVEIEDENTSCLPQTAYGVSKLAAERVVLEEAPLSCSVVLRPALVYGRGSKGNLAMLAKAVQSGFFPRIVFPSNFRSMIHVEDVVTACILAGTNQKACGKTYILTDGQDYSTMEIVENLSSISGKKMRVRLPFCLLRACALWGDTFGKIGVPWPLTSERLDKLSGSARYSNARICRDLGFVPSWTLEQGLREMVGQ